jgi:beta-N-acetylhexosaminidase
MGMTAHITYSAFDDRPATLSPKMMGLIRNDIGFDGLIMTDDLSMKALQGSFADRCNASFGAGCDVVLHCNGIMDEMAQVADATPALTGTALIRAEAALNMRKTPEPFDIGAAKEQFHHLMEKAA